MRSAAGVGLVLAVLVVTGCQERDADRQVIQEPLAMPDAVDTTAEALWTHLQQNQYATAWQHWPNREPFYPGQEPHGALLRTYLNPVAYGALQRGDSVLPAGSIIVKESYTQGRELINITSMSKVSGFAPDASDWFWMATQPDGSTEAAGRVAMCRDCHTAGRDFVMTPIAPR
jgi:hypothetical protein